MPDQFLIDDGIIVWFDGPEWDDVAAEVFRDMADDIESTAKANAPWADRTGAARAGLTAEVDSVNGDIVLTLFHTEEHGLWLEVIQNGRFAIIMRTLEEYAPKAFEEASIRLFEAREGKD